MSHLARTEAEDTFSGEEATALQERLGPDQADLQGAVTLRDVAEATGLSEADVAAHLRQIRAEAAFRPRRAAHSPALPWIAGAALLTAVGVTWWRLHLLDVAVSPDFSRSPRSVLAPVVSSPTRSVETSPLLVDATMNGISLPPVGFRVEAIGQRTDCLGEGSYGEAPAMPYEKVRDGLARSGESLVEKVFAQEGFDRAPAGTRYHGMEGGIFSPRQGYVHLSMSGWAGVEVGWIAVPLTEAGKRQIYALAVKTLADAQAEQDAALQKVSDYREGVVSPPPGFRFRFAGRRLDIQRGPRVSFSGLSLPSVTDRLEASLMNAIHRDAGPPVGPWSGRVGNDAKIPVPDLSRIEILGPKGIVTADLPTRPGDVGTTRRTVRALAERMAKQFEGVQEKKL